MKKFKLLLLDAGVIIGLFELALWEVVLSQCDVHVSETIMAEANFYIDKNDLRQPLNLEPYRSQITVHDVPASRLSVLRSGIVGSLLDRMDAGEAELLCVLDDGKNPFSICSSDSVVYQYLGATQRSGQGISLEEVLQTIGRTQNVDWKYTQKFREDNARRGFNEGFTGQTLR